VEDIKDEVGAIFKAYSETAEDKADKVDKVDKAELPELLAEEVIRMGLPTVSTTWEPMAAVPKLDLKVVNLPKELIFAARRAGKPICGFSVSAESIDLSA